jgi:acyl-CoA synthetase (AMP-forming)/AMP-acid ligase II
MAKVVIVDRELAPLMQDALELTQVTPLVVQYDDPGFDGPQAGNGAADYEHFLATGNPDFAWLMPDDEWDAISINYTSGTTGEPKGVVSHHRGAYLLAQGNALTTSMAKHAVYLWTLPMFHCNGWCFPWTLSAIIGTRVCLRQVRADPIWTALAESRVTHLCGAPIVMSLLVSASDDVKRKLAHRVQFFTAAAPPPEKLLADMNAAGFDVTHLYGLTETYGPAVVNEWHVRWSDLPPAEQAALKARRVRYLPLEQLAVLDPDTMAPVPRDGQTMGEVMFRGNVVMKGYFRNPTGNAEGLRGRMVSFRGPGRRAFGRLHPAQGQIQGHYHFGRREHLLDRGRGSSLPPPGRRGGCRRGNAARKMGRDALRVHRTCRRSPNGFRRPARMVPRSTCLLQGPGQVRLHAHPTNIDRQNPENPFAGASQGLGWPKCRDLESYLNSRHCGYRVSPRPRHPMAFLS